MNQVHQVFCCCQNNSHRKYYIIAHNKQYGTRNVMKTLTKVESNRQEEADGTQGCHSERKEKTRLRG